jgi:hypothetical protein
MTSSPVEDVVTRPLSEVLSDEEAPPFIVTVVLTTAASAMTAANFAFATHSSVSSTETTTMATSDHRENVVELMSVLRQ